MRLLISDANILIDMEAGALMHTLFKLPMQFGIPDLRYYPRYTAVEIDALKGTAQRRALSTTALKGA